MAKTLIVKVSLIQTRRRQTAISMILVCRRQWLMTKQIWTLSPQTVSQKGAIAVTALQHMITTRGVYRYGKSYRYAYLYRIVVPVFCTGIPCCC